MNPAPLLTTYHRNRYPLSTGWDDLKAGVEAWSAVGLDRITLHECRHTYASFLMAAGYTLRELMEYMGHSSLQATERYVKLLPPLDETDPAERLIAYLRRRAQ